MKVKSIILCLMMISICFAGCLGVEDPVINEDESEPSEELSDDWPSYYVVTANDLPVCDANTLGRLYYVEADTNFQACTSNGWTIIQIGGNTSSPSLTVNHPPSISAQIWPGEGSTLLMGSSDGDGTRTLHIFLDWNVSDSDGNISSLGVDTDNDGLIDVPLFSNTGVLTQESIEIETDQYVNGSIPVPMEVGNTFFRSNDYSDEGCILFWSKRITLIAVDDLGATSSKQIILNDYVPHKVTHMLASIQGVSTAYGISAADLAWISSAACMQHPSINTNNEYRAEDHPSATTSGMTDTLLRLSFVNGPDDLEWQHLNITLFDEEQGKSYKCTPNGVDCSIGEETADSVWRGSEVISIAEGGSTDICGQSGNGGDEGNSCELKILIWYKGTQLEGTTSIVAVV